MQPSASEEIYCPMPPAPHGWIQNHANESWALVVGLNSIPEQDVTKAERNDNQAWWVPTASPESSRRQQVPASAKTRRRRSVRSARSEEIGRAHAELQSL